MKLKNTSKPSSSVSRTIPSNASSKKLPPGVSAVHGYRGLNGTFYETVEEAVEANRAAVTKGYVTVAANKILDELNDNSPGVSHAEDCRVIMVDNDADDLCKFLTNFWPIIEKTVHLIHEKLQGSGDASDNGETGLARPKTHTR